jgi:hypothetical protein
VQLEDKQNEAIHQIIKSNPRIGLQEVTDKLKNDFAIVLKRSTIHKRLTKELGYQFMSLVPPIAPFLTIDNEQII